MTAVSRGGTYLVDGTNLLYRAYHALQGFRTSTGVPTHAVYGFLTMILRVLREQEPEDLAVVFDPPGPTQKHRLFAEYKANREGTPDDLKVQIPHVLRALDALGIPRLTIDGYEADDVLGSLVVRLTADGREVTIVTGDKDLCQLVGPRVRLLDTMKDRFTGPEEVLERFGVAPERVVDLLALTGDAVDNLPGVPGVGVKTAAGLLARYGTLEAVVERAAEEKGKRGAALREHGGRALANRALVTIDTGVPLPFGLEAVARRAIDRVALADVLRELEFHRLLKELGVEGVAEAPPAARASDEADPPGHWVAVFAGPPGQPWALAGAHTARDPFDPRAAGLGPWARSLSAPGAAIVGHGLKAAWEELGRAGVALGPPWLDTEVAAYLLSPGRRAYRWEDLARERSIPVSDTGDPAACAAALLALAAALERELDRASLLGLCREIEMPLVPILAEMETAGVKVDRAALSALSLEYAGRLEALEAQMFELAGEPFLPQSPKQLGRILFEKLHLPAGKKTATGPSTDASVLEELSLLHPLPGLVLAHRSLAKLKGTFIDVLPALADPETGRIHARFHQTVTATGRLSSSDPNLQNIPVRGDEGRRIREAFIAEPGCVLLSADYSQVELRILAHLCDDPALVEVFRSGRDIHAETASRVYGVTLAEVDARMRREAKTVNFGILYGISPFGLARQLGIAQEAARTMIEAYFHQFPAVRAFLDRLVVKARGTGFAETLFGRRRPIPELASRNRQQREFGERMAVNTPIQGTAADLIKRAMIHAVGALRSQGVEARLILQVHDELVFEVAEERAAQALGLVRSAMEGAAALRVPLSVDAGWGNNWYQAHR
ncbi:MAG: DNA polymerase I [Deltaproteobacteria bacterium]|nr:DNA polymerase I [Deltaproteobacteria bacterium]